MRNDTIIENANAEQPEDPSQIVLRDEQLVPYFYQSLPFDTSISLMLANRRIFRLFKQEFGALSAPLPRVPEASYEILRRINYGVFPDNLIAQLNADVGPDLPLHFKYCVDVKTRVVPATMLAARHNRALINRYCDKLMKEFIDYVPPSHLFCPNHWYVIEAFEILASYGYQDEVMRLYKENIDQKCYRLMMAITALAALLITAAKYGDVDKCKHLWSLYQPALDKFFAVEFIVNVDIPLTSIEFLKKEAINNVLKKAIQVATRAKQKTIVEHFTTWALDQSFLDILGPKDAAISLVCVGASDQYKAFRMNADTVLAEELSNINPNSKRRQSAFMFFEGTLLAAAMANNVELLQETWDQYLNRLIQAAVDFGSTPALVEDIGSCAAFFGHSQVYDFYQATILPMMLDYDRRLRYSDAFLKLWQKNAIYKNLFYAAFGNQREFIEDNHFKLDAWVAAVFLVDGYSNMLQQLVGLERWDMLQYFFQKMSNPDLLFTHLHRMVAVSLHAEPPVPGAQKSIEWWLESFEKLYQLRPKAMLLDKKSLEANIGNIENVEINQRAMAIHVKYMALAAAAANASIEPDPETTSSMRMQGL